VKSSDEKNIGAATWTGRQQAFAMMATKCTLAQADCLRQLRETRAYEAYGLTWDEFCKQHAGMARSQADRLIHQLNEFGETYFRLSELVRVSDETYRKLASHIEDDTIELAGCKLALTRENAPQIRAAIHGFREEFRNLQIELIYQRPGLADLQTKLEDTLHEFQRRARFPLPTDQRESLANLLRHMIYRMNQVAREFKRPAKTP
jgi:hypothetical protein